MPVSPQKAVKGEHCMKEFSPECSPLGGASCCQLASPRGLWSNSCTPAQPLSTPLKCLILAQNSFMIVCDVNNS